jgi:hypothetical protein
MADRSEELRSKAARCLALAQTTADPEARAKLDREKVHARSGPDSSSYTHGRDRP